MNDVSNKPLAAIAAAISKFAPALAAHVVQATQIEMQKNMQSDGVPYCVLLLKMAAVDLEREFAAGIKEMEPAEVPLTGEPGFGVLNALVLEPLDEQDPTLETMQRSTEIFTRLASDCRARGMGGMEAYGKRFFVSVLRRSMAKARIDNATAARILPFACVALDASLERVYADIEKRLTS